jgi:hypothetical protein
MSVEQRQAHSLAPPLQRKTLEEISRRRTIPWWVTLRPSLRNPFQGFAEYSNHGPCSHAIASGEYAELDTQGRKVRLHVDETTQEISAVIMGGRNRDSSQQS